MKPSFSRFGRPAGAVLLLSCAGSALAQDAATATLGEVTVTGTASGAGADPATPAAHYSGAGLLLRSRATLGETLSGTPGISSSYFGPNASRPIVRGQDGDRVPILSNGGASADVSALSFDHAVPADPISIERIELLRGPAALLYGSQTNGVLNLVDNRIAREPQFDAAGGVAGKVDLGYATVNRERSGAALVETGTDRYALHVDAFARKSGDVEVPIDLACTRGGLTTVARRICNSANETRGGALGGTLFLDHGYLGASVASYRSDYGTVAEDDVTIGMRQHRHAIEGGWRFAPDRWIESLRTQFSHTGYRHTEYEGQEAGTTFRKRANDLRVEARQRRTTLGAGGALSGTFGLQSTDSRFSAEGEEAFAPPSRSLSRALFGLEQWSGGWGQLALSGRLEDARVEAFGDPDVERFTAASRSYRPASVALGGVWNLASVTRALADWQLTADAAHVERAPQDYELYANGPHLATGAYETGNAGLGKERSSNVDLGARWQRGANRFRLDGFYNRYQNYLAQLATGVRRNGDGSVAQGAGGLPEFVYAGVPARFVGLEASGNLRLAGGAKASDGASTLDLELRTDRVRATNLQSGEALPRIPPWRAGATLAWKEGPWGARLGFDHLARQDRVPTGDVPVAGYNLWELGADHRMKAGRANLLWYARVSNIGNTLAYSATSVLTQTAPGRAPLPGRSLKIGLQASF